MMLVIVLLLKVAQWLIIARLLLSLAPALRYHPVGSAVISLTEPVLRPLRALTVAGGASLSLDLSPMLALLLICGARLLLGI